MSRKRAGPVRLAEKCLYSYNENLARLDVLRKDLKVLRVTSSVQAQRYDAVSAHGNGGHSDPVMARMLRIEGMERLISWLERRTLPIQRMVADLEGPDVLPNSPKADLLKVLRLLYFGNNLLSQVADEMKVSRQFVHNKREELRKMAISYLGI